MFSQLVANKKAFFCSFPVDFSTANIYNSSQWNINNNNVPQSAKGSLAFGGLPSNNSTSTSKCHLFKIQIVPSTKDKRCTTTHFLQISFTITSVKSLCVWQALLCISKVQPRLNCVVFFNCYLHT